MSGRFQRAIRGVLVTAAFCATTSTLFAAPAVRSFEFTDVTPRSFRVVWLSDQGATATVRLFQAPACVNEIFTATIMPHPTLGGDPALVQAAQDNGVMVVEVSGLTPDTEYCVRTVTVATLDNLVTEAPAVPLRVTTEKLTTRGRVSGPDLVAFSNDLVVLSITSSVPATPTEGALVLLRATGASSPLAAWVGDGVDDDGDPVTPTTYVFFDLNNLYDATTRESLDLLGDGTENLAAVVLGGPEGYVEAISRIVPGDTGLSAVVAPMSCRDAPTTVCAGILGDADDDGIVGLADAEAIQDHVLGLIPVLNCMVCSDVTGDLNRDMKDALGVGQTAVGLRVLP